MCYTPDTSCARKEWNPLPERFSYDRAAPSLRTVWKRAMSIMVRSSGIALSPRAPATNLGGHRGVRVDYVGQSGEVRRPTVSTGSTRMMLGWKPDFTIQADVKSRKWKLSSGS